MRFYTRKKASPTIIIMSLVDILAILLIFFIVTTTFKKEQPQLKINLPDSKTAKSLAADDKKDPILLAVRDENNISLGDKPVKLADLSEALQQAHTQNPDRPIALQADRLAPLGVVVKVLDALKEADIQNVPLFTQPQPQK